MKEITHDYTYDWKMTGKYNEIYGKEVSLMGNLTWGLLSEEEVFEYNSHYGDIWDGLYAKILDIDDPKNKPKIYVGSSLKILLEFNNYHNYFGPIKIYGIFGFLPTTRTHIARIYKADILDNDGNIVKTIERELHYPN